MESEENTRERTRHTGSILGAGTTPVWNPTQLLQTESSIRSTVSVPASSESSIVNLDLPSLSPTTPRTHTRAPSSAMAIENLIHPSNIFNFTPINAPRPPTTTSESFALQTGRSLLDFDINMIQYPSYATQQQSGEHTLPFDRSPTMNSNDDTVWHMNHDPTGTFSGVFKNDEVEKYETFARNKANEIREKREGPERKAITLQILKQVRFFMNEDADISVERSSFVEYGEPVLCERPGCHHENALPADTYYVNVGWEFFFCLRCYEQLLAGRYTEGCEGVDIDEDLDQISRDSATVSSLGLDGSNDRMSVYQTAPRRSTRQIAKQTVAEDMLLDPATHTTVKIPPRKFKPAASRKRSQDVTPDKVSQKKFLQQTALQQTPPEEMVIEPLAQASDQGHRGEPEYETRQIESQLFSPPPAPEYATPVKATNETLLNDSPLADSPSSIYSDGEWIYPPTASQRIAHKMKAGVTLSPTDKAAFAVWQEASKAQLRWNRHLWKTKCTREYYAELCDEDKGLNAEPLDLGKEMTNYNDLIDYEKRIGLRKKDCYGRELLHVLKEATRYTTKG